MITFRLNSIFAKRPYTFDCMAAHFTFLRTSLGHEIPIDHKYWQTYMGSDKGIVLDDFANYLEDPCLIDTVDELELLWPKTGSTLDNYISVCFKLCVQKQVVLATLLRGLRLKGVAWSPIIGGNATDRCLNLFADSYNSNVEQMCLARSEQEYASLLNQELNELVRSVPKKVCYCGDKRDFNEIFVVSSITELEYYSTISSGAKIAYIDKLPPWGNIEGISNTIMISSVKVMIECLKLDTKLSLHMSMYRLIREIIYSDSYSPSSTLRLSLASMKKSWEQIIQSARYLFKEELEECIPNKSLNLLIAPDHPYTSLACTIIPLVAIAQDIYTLPHMFTNFSETWLDKGVVHTLMPPLAEYEFSYQGDNRLTFLGIQEIYQRRICSRVDRRSPRTIIFGGVCPEPRGKFGWTPLHYLKTVIRLLEYIQNQHPDEIIYVKNKHREPLEPRLITLARIFKQKLSQEQMSLLMYVDDISCNGSIEESVQSGDECYFLQDGSSIDKCRLIGASTNLVVGNNGRTYNYMGAGEKLGELRESLKGNLTIISI